MERHDVVVLGAGLAGLVAAYQLRTRDVVVLESSNRVGGRTLSGGSDESWFNRGAQIISGRHLADLCGQLGLELVPAHNASFGIAVNDALAIGASPLKLLARMPISLRGRLNLARTALRLRRLNRAVGDKRSALDRISLEALIGASVSPTTVEILNVFCESTVASGIGDVSALIGLAYSLELFLKPSATQTFSAARGGNQKICEALSEQVGSERIRLDTRVLSVRAPNQGGAVVHTMGPKGAMEIRADACVCALPAPTVLEVVEGLSPAKRAALEAVCPYHPIVTVVFAERSAAPAPWDGVMMLPLINRSPFCLISNNGFFANADPTSTRVPAYLMIEAAGSRGRALDDVGDVEVIRLAFEAVNRVFPEAAELLVENTAIVTRWDALPRFTPGYMMRRSALRESLRDSVFFCGDYTSQPGLQGAIGSALATARLIPSLVS